MPSAEFAASRILYDSLLLPAGFGGIVTTRCRALLRALPNHADTSQCTTCIDYLSLPNDCGRSAAIWAPETALVNPGTPGRFDALLGLSIRLKLFLLIGGLLVAVTAFYSWASYREMRSSALIATSARLRGVATQWASALASSRAQQLTNLRKTRDSAAVRAYLMHTDTLERDSLGRVLTALFRIDSQKPAGSRSRRIRSRARFAGYSTPLWYRALS